MDISVGNHCFTFYLHKWRPLKWLKFKYEHIIWYFWLKYTSKLSWMSSAEIMLPKFMVILYVLRSNSIFIFFPIAALWNSDQCNVIQQIKKCGLIAVCIYRHVITMGFRSKYDVDGHYFIFALFIATVTSCQRIQHDVTVAMLPHTAVIFRMQ